MVKKCQEEQKQLSNRTRSVWENGSGKAEHCICCLLQLLSSCFYSRIFPCTGLWSHLKISRLPRVSWGAPGRDLNISSSTLIPISSGRRLKTRWSSACTVLLSRSRCRSYWRWCATRWWRSGLRSFSRCQPICRILSPRWSCAVWSFCFFLPVRAS